jgi:type IV pilus assembly protein PilA
MNTNLKAKLLQHFANKKKEGGFTLIELLVVIIIIGILAAIALPSFLNQANKAKQSEAKTYIGSMNRAQQAYFLENDSMANEANFGGLGLGISSQTSNYQYRIVTPTGVTSQVTNQARPSSGNSASIKAYIGGVNVGQVTNTNEATTLAVLCEGVNAPVAGGPIGDVAATYANNGPDCPGSYKKVK